VLIKYNNKKFGKFLKSQRIKSKMSQIAVSRKFGYTSAQFISNFERGRCSAPLKVLKVLINLYNLNSNDLIHKIITEQKIFLRKNLK